MVGKTRESRVLTSLREVNTGIIERLGAERLDSR